MPQRGEDRPIEVDPSGAETASQLVGTGVAAELRRVAKRRVIVVVPKERPYRYTFNLHLHFFPYEHALRAALGEPAYRDSLCETVDGDLYHRENID